MAVKRGGHVCARSKMIDAQLLYAAQQHQQQARRRRNIVCNDGD